MKEKKNPPKIFLNTENFVHYLCSRCGQENVTEVDITGGFSQEYIEDCQVCCSPNLLRIMFNESTKNLDVEVEDLG